MHLFSSVTIELIKLYYLASKSTIYVQSLIFKIKDAAKISKIGDWQHLVLLLHYLYYSKTQNKGTQL